MTTLALIPARGGSKGVLRKNLRSISGRTLIARAVEAAQGSGAVDHILVSTDDEEIAQEARRCGADVPFLRPTALADDMSPIGPAVVNAVREFERHIGDIVDVLVLLEPTSPFRNANHVRQAVEKYNDGKYRSVISVCPLERKPENIFVKTDSGLQRYIKDPDMAFNFRQDMVGLCRLNSAVYVVSRKDFFEFSKFVLEPTGFIEMTGIESINIDEELDLMVAEAVAARLGL